MAKRIYMPQVEQGIRLTRYTLSIFGLGVMYRIHIIQAVLMILHAGLSFLVLSYSCYVYRHQIHLLAITLHHNVLMLVQAFGPVLGIVYHTVYNDFFNDSYWTYDYESDLMLKKMQPLKETYGKSLSNVFKLVVIGIAYTQALFALTAIIESYINNDNRQLLFPMWVPFELDTYPAYISVLVWEMLNVFNLSTVVISNLTVIYVFYSHIKTEIEILLYALENIQERAHEMARNHADYHENENDYVSSQILHKSYVKCAKMCAEHHIEIIRYFTMGMKIHDTNYFIIFMAEIILFTCTGFALISDNNVLRIKFAGITVIQLILPYLNCLAAQLIAEDSVSVRDAIYSMKWYTIPKECQSTFKLMMMRASKPLVIQMLTGQIADLEAFMWLVKASYSYFNMILAITQ